MRKTLTILLLFFAVKSYSQTANAGADQTIYLSQGTSSATLDGSASSATSYLWSEISTDFSSGGAISSATSKSTTVTGLTKQGTFYFQIAATTGGTTKYDTMAVIVNKSPVPASAFFMVGAPYDSIASTVNNYSDTTINSGGGQWHVYPGYTIFFDRGRSLDMNVDNQNRKFKSTVEDGYSWAQHDYGRAEMSYGYGGGQGAPIDSNQTYLFEWKGYFPQSETQAAFTQGGNIFGVTTIMQLHSKDAYSPPFQFVIRENVAGDSTKGHNISFVEIDSNTLVAAKPFAQYNDLYNKSHTIRMYLKEGKPGGNGFVKVTYDDTSVYYRSASISDSVVGRASSWQSNYPKFATVYDFDNRVANNIMADSVAARARGKKFSLITESWNEYTLDTTYGVTSPTAKAGSDQSITLPTNSISLSGSGTAYGGATITGYAWTKQSGGSATITSPTSASTTITGLTQGVYDFRLTVTDSNSKTGYDDVQVTVNPTGITNTLILYGNYIFK